MTIEIIWKVCWTHRMRCLLLKKNTTQAAKDILSCLWIHSQSYSHFFWPNKKRVCKNCTLPTLCRSWLPLRSLSVSCWQAVLPAGGGVVGGWEIDACPLPIWNMFVYTPHNCAMLGGIGVRGGEVKIRCLHHDPSLAEGWVTHCLMHGLGRPKKSPSQCSTVSFKNKVIKNFTGSAVDARGVGGPSPLCMRACVCVCLLRVSFKNDD